MVPQDLTDVLAAHVLGPTVHDYHNVHIPENHIFDTNCYTYSYHSAANQEVGCLKCLYQLLKILVLLSRVQ